MGTLIVNKTSHGQTFVIGAATSDGISVITKAEQKIALMGDDSIEVEIISNYAIPFAIGQWISVYGRRYTINMPVKVKKLSSKNYSYNVSFGGGVFQLKKVQNLLTHGFGLVGDFSLMGTIVDHMHNIITNIKRVYGNNWWFTLPVAGIAKNITFSPCNVFEALNQVCEEFEMEWSVSQVGTTLNNEFRLKVNAKVGTEDRGTFSVGQGLGLLNLERNPIKDKNYVTTLFAYGSNRNIPSNYRDYSPRLRPTGIGTSLSLDAQVFGYGIVEEVKIWEDIFPTRTGTLSGVGAGGTTFSDSSMDFDLLAENESGDTLYLIPDVEAKIHFQSGKLAGYEFIISGYTHSTFTFEIKTFTDERGLVLPNPDNTEFQPDIGDTYKLVDIQMPESYITAAEAELYDAAMEYLTANSNPVYQLVVDVDEVFISLLPQPDGINYLFDIGDYMTIVDSALKLNATVRITGFTRDVFRPYRYKFTLSDTSIQRKTERRLLIGERAHTATLRSKLNRPENVRLVNAKNILPKKGDVDGGSSINPIEL
jgi:hypothetical protein